MIFLESPWPILFLGIVVEAILAVALLRSGRGVLLWAMAGVAALVLVGLLVQRSVITDTKRVRQTLEEVAAGLEANDLQRVAAMITPKPDGDATRGAAKLALASAEFKTVSLRGVETEFNYVTPLPTAKVTFFVMISARLRGVNDLGEQTRPAQLQVTMRKEGDRWLIVDHKIIQDPREG